MGVPGNRDIARLSAQVEELNANIEKLARKRPGARSGDGKRSGASASTAH
jgi:hypothetical protein